MNFLGPSSDEQGKESSISDSGDLHSGYDVTDYYQERGWGGMCFSLLFYFFHNLFQNSRLSRTHKHQINLSCLGMNIHVIISNEWVLLTNH